MKPTRQLANELFADKVRQAKAMTPEERVLAGMQLFELSCAIMRDGIRNQFPAANEEDVERHLRERLAVARRIEATR